MTEPLQTLDDYGVLRLPNGSAATEEPIGDPALLVLGEYLESVLNGRVQEIWASAFPAGVGCSGSVVGCVQYHNPEQGPFLNGEVPQLFLWRTGSISPPEWICDDGRMHTDGISVWWIAPAAVQEDRRKRDPFLHVIGKAIDAAICRERDPLWVQGDQGVESSDDYDPISAKYGTSILIALQAFSLRVLNCKPKDLQLKGVGGKPAGSGQTGPFPGVLVTLELKEQDVRQHDPSERNTTSKGSGGLVSTVDGDPVEPMSLADWVLTNP